MSTDLRDVRMMSFAFLASGSYATSLNGVAGHNPIRLVGGVRVEAGWLGEGDLEGLSRLDMVKPVSKWH